MRTEEAGQVLKSSFVAEVLTSNSPALTGFKVKEISQKNGDMKIRMLPQKGFYQIVWGIQYGVLYVVSESYLPSASSNHRFPSQFKLSNLEASAARLTFC